VKKPEPRRTEAPPPPPDKKPPPPPNQKPRRVVGITLDSTNATGGGDGPAFNVGNTREGETETTAADPRKVDRAPPPPPVGTNQKASRIPTGGAKYVLPKRKRPAKPPYPEVLRTQGIEASVTVLVNLDATGKVTSVKIIKSGGFPEFDEAARKTALAEQFEPAMRDGNPIPYTLSYTYRFTLEQ
jgi:protein TonB